MIFYHSEKEKKITQNIHKKQSPCWQLGCPNSSIIKSNASSFLCLLVYSWLFYKHLLQTVTLSGHMGYREKWATVSPSRSPQSPGLLLTAPMNVPLSFLVTIYSSFFSAGQQCMPVLWAESYPTKFLCWIPPSPSGPQSMSVFGERLYKEG